MKLNQSKALTEFAQKVLKRELLSAPLAYSEGDELDKAVRGGMLFFEGAFSSQESMLKHALPMMLFPDDSSPSGRASKDFRLRAALIDGFYEYISPEIVENHWTVAFDYLPNADPELDGAITFLWSLKLGDM